MKLDRMIGILAVLLRQEKATAWGLQDLYFGGYGGITR